MKRGNKSYALRAVMGAGVIVLASLGSSLASNVAIGSSDGTTEFGQGEFTLKVCDSWIQLNLLSGSTGAYGSESSGLSALTGITIEGLDASQCKSTKFTIQAFDQSHRQAQTPAFCSLWAPLCLASRALLTAG